MALGGRVIILDFCDRSRPVEKWPFFQAAVATLVLVEFYKNGLAWVCVCVPPGPHWNTKDIPYELTDQLKSPFLCI